MNATTALVGMSIEEMERWAEENGQPAYRGRQLYQWIYRRGAVDFSEMTNLPKAWRQELSKTASLSALKVAAERVSSDGTTKYLMELQDGEQIESVLIPDGSRLTLCVSSQVGCGQKCSFCATALLGLRRNLTAGEILGQALEASRRVGRDSLTNMVFMGMGEPLANYKNLMTALRVLSHPEGFALGARKITVSTSGLAPAIRRFAREKLKAGLALSLNATTDETRNDLIPSNRRYTIANVLAACLEWIKASKRRLTIEYAMIRDVNDTAEDAYRLRQLLRDVPSKVNLIPFNPIPGSSYVRPRASSVLKFQRIMLDGGIGATVRKTKGQDIEAACGQLRASTEGSTQKRARSRREKKGYASAGR